MFGLLDLLLPRRCVLCGATRTALCLDCLVALPPAPDLAPPPGFSDFAALLSYEDLTRRLIAAIKFDRCREAIDLPAGVLARLVDWEVDAVTWAPTSEMHRRQRGFDQAELMARVIASTLGVPCNGVLERRSGSGHQTGRSRRTRLESVGFRCTAGRAFTDEYASVLVVDDVRTTGATLCAAGDALLGAGVHTVTAATLAVTP